MTCIRCGEHETPAVHTFRRTIDGCSFVAEVEVDACKRCDERDVPVALILGFDRAVAADLARRGPVSGETFRFMRKAIPLQPLELARLLGVSVETVNRWESSKRAVDVAPWLVVASIVLDRFEGPSPLLSRVDAVREAPEAERVVDVRALPVRTLADVLSMMGSAVVLSDVDIADALGVAIGPMRKRLEALAAVDLVTKEETLGSGAIRWSLREPARHVMREARERGFALHAPLPQTELVVARVRERETNVTSASPSC